jgi:dTDP-glucose 4,6-dehydratase
MFDQRRILVTGGAGFIGSEVVRQLHEMRAEITVLDNFTSGKPQYLNGLNIEIVHGDVCDKEVITNALKDQEMVIHLAALPFIPDCYVNPGAFFQVNTIGTMNLMWGSIQSESVEKFVHISSSEVYGSAKYIPMDENHPTLPQSTYAAGKLAADRAVFTLHKEHDFPAVIIRPFNSYGPRITQPYIVPEIITQLLRGGRVYLGNVESSRDFTYVDDTAKGIILALTEEKAIGETINICSGGDIKIGDLACLIARLMRKNIQLEQDESRFRPYDVERLLGDYTKAKGILGWEPKIPPEEGLRRTIEWIKSNPIEFKEPFKGWPRAMRG